MTRSEPGHRDLVLRAKEGDLDAYGALVRATQAMTLGVASGVLRDPALAEDAAQETYLRAFRRLADLDDPSAFAGWLRRITITVALNMRRARRRTLLQLDELPEIPVLDEDETSWTAAQRQRLSRALLTLTPEERRLCDRRYHGGWPIARLAAAARIDESAMRKRLQRLRDKLRKEMEVTEQRLLRPEDIRPEFPDAIVELLARPELTELPENPVGSVLGQLRAVYADFAHVELPEVLDLAEAQRTIAADAMYIDASELHRIDDCQVLRYDLTLPLLQTIRYDGEPLRIFAAGKAYRQCQPDATHLEAFHQAEVLGLDDLARVDPWQVTALVLRSIHQLLPGRAVKIVPTRYAMCREAWELEIDDDGRWFEVMAWGLFTDRIVRHLGGNPARQSAFGVGYGLERLAMLRYGIDDIRKVEGATVVA